MANVCGRTVDAVSSEVDRRFESGDVSGAVQCIRHALTISPTLTSVYVGLGDVLATTVHLEEAAAAYQSAIRQESRSMDIYYRMGMLYGGQDQTAQARSSFQAAVALSPTSVESLFALGICMSLENDWFEAERHIRRVLRLRPGHESARFDLAVALPSATQTPTRGSQQLRWLPHHLYEQCRGAPRGLGQSRRCPG